jgi:hypothetical protein
MSHPPPNQPPILVAVPDGPPPMQTHPGAALGRPGASALAYYSRRRAAEWTLYRHTLPLRLAAVTLAGVFVGFVTGHAGPALAGWGAALTAVTVGWRLRFRVSQNARNWARGARGERRTARQLARLTRHGWVVFHDLAIPGSGANADHLAVGPGGIFLLDSKNWRGRLAFTPDGTLWHGSYPLTATLATIAWEASAIADALGVPAHSIQPMMVVHGSTIPWGEQYLGGVAILPAGRLVTTLLALPPLLTGQQVAQLADRAITFLRPAA